MRAIVVWVEGDWVIGNAWRLRYKSGGDPTTEKSVRRSGGGLYRKAGDARTEGSAGCRHPPRRLGRRRGDGTDDDGGGWRRNGAEHRQEPEAPQSGGAEGPCRQRKRLLQDGRSSASGGAQAAVLCATRFRSEERRVGKS